MLDVIGWIAAETWRPLALGAAAAFLGGIVAVWLTR